MFQEVSQTIQQPSVQTVLTYFFVALREYLHVVLIVLAIVLLLLIVRYNRALRDLVNGLWKFTSGSWDKYALGITHIDIDIKAKGQIGSTEFEFSQPIRQRVEIADSTFFSVLGQKISEQILGKTEPSKKKKRRRGNNG